MSSCVSFIQILLFMTLTDGVSIANLPSNRPVYACVSNSSSWCICDRSLSAGLNSQIFATAGNALRMRSHKGKVSDSDRPRCHSASNDILKKTTAGNQDQKVSALAFRHQVWTQPDSQGKFSSSGGYISAAFL